MKHNQKKINNFFFAIFALFLILGAAVPAAAETSIVWSQEIGNVAAADMSEDGQTIYAAVGSQVFIYDAAGVQQNVFTVGGNVVKLVCTADGTRAALYTDGEEVYYIDNGAITWSQSFTAITDIDISNAGSVLIVESSSFHKILSDGTTEYDSASGTFSIGAIDPNDEFAILKSGNSDLRKYILSTTDQYWGKINNQTFNTAFQNYQNALAVYVNNTVNSIILNKNTLGSDLFDTIYQFRSNAISNQDLSSTNPYTYYDGLGVDWTVENNSAPWSGRYYSSSWVFDNKLWIGGGYGSSGILSDVWYSSDGASWTLATSAAPWTARFGAVSWVFDNKLWIGGGRLGTSNVNDIWCSSDGSTWTQITSAAPWSARYGAVSWVFDNKLWIGGGYGQTTGDKLSDIWYSSDGVSWTQATSTASWTGRRYASSWVYDNKLWIGGGESSSNLHDVWYSSDGASWTQATSAASWTARQGAASWVYGNKLWIGGGRLGTSNVNDIWCSSDGSTWTQVISAAPWSARYGAASWVFDNKLWIGGGQNNARLNDIWSSDPSLIIQPSSTNPTLIFYRFTGSSPQHTQTTYTNSVLFTGTTELRTKPILSIYNLQTTKTFTGTIQAISLSDRGDWVGTVTDSNIYHDQITNAGFGTEYTALLGSTGTVYDIATANAASMSITGQGQITDIYSQTVSRVGTYTAGGAVTHVDIADKNALWASSGGEDGKVYIFSKDESSNWYLEYSSDSEGSITALKMSGRGEYVLAGRSGSLTLYQTNTPELVNTDFWFTLYTYRDSDSYRNAAINVSVYSSNTWSLYAQGVTDSIGKYVVQLKSGDTYKFDIGAGQKVLIYQATPSITSQVVSIYTSPISAAVTYEAEWDPEIGGVSFDYTDSSGQTQTVIVKITRTDNWQTVYEETFTGQQSIEQAVPIMDDTVGYKVEISATRSSGVTRNTYFVSASRDIVPIPLDRNVMNILFSCLLIFLAGLFSYISAVRGALVVALCAVLFVYMGWLTIPWYWLTVAVVLAFVAGFTQRRS